MSKLTVTRPMAIAMGAVLLDQLTKAIVAALIPLNSGVEILPFFTLVHVLNPGAAFSFLSEQPGWQRWLFTVFGLIVSAILAILIRRNPKALVSCGYAFIIGGAIANVSDRLWRGAVVDWLDFHIGSLHWPAFNLADSFIFVGVAVLVYASFFPTSKAHLERH